MLESLFIKVTYLKVCNFIKKKLQHRRFPVILQTFQEHLFQKTSDDLGWTIDSVIEQNVNILKYKPLRNSSYIKLPKELNHSRKHSLHIQNTGNKKML